MGKKKMRIEMKHSSDESEFEEDGGTDEELQEAFARGELNGSHLHAIVAMKPVDQHVNNVVGLKDKLSQIKLNYDWIERLDLVNEPAKVMPEVEAQYGDVSLKTNRKGQISGQEVDDKQDHDFKREFIFYRQGQASVIEAMQRLHKAGVITKRPDDYFAEMAKSDDHMVKVRQNLIHRQSAMEASEKAKKLREMRKYGKQIQQEVLKKRQKDKKEMMEKLKKFKKGKGESLDFLNDDHNRNNTGSNKKGKKQGQNKASQKRSYKNQRFGFGGQKKRSKYNTSESAADMSSFRSSKHGRPTNKSSKRPNQRPGKSKRRNMKSKKR